MDFPIAGATEGTVNAFGFGHVGRDVAHYPGGEPKVRLGAGAGGSTRRRMAGVASGHGGQAPRNPCALVVASRRSVAPAGGASGWIGAGSGCKRPRRLRNQHRARRHGRIHAEAASSPARGSRRPLGSEQAAPPAVHGLAAAGHGAHRGRARLDRSNSDRAALARTARSGDQCKSPGPRRGCARIRLAGGQAARRGAEPVSPHRAGHHPRHRDTTDVGTIGFGITLDLPIFDHAQGRIAEEKATRQQLFDELASRTFDARADAAKAYADLELLRPQSEESLRMESRLEALESHLSDARKSGDADIVQVNQARNDLADARMETLRLSGSRRRSCASASKWLRAHCSEAPSREHHRPSAHRIRRSLRPGDRSRDRGGPALAREDGRRGRRAKASWRKACGRW